MTGLQTLKNIGPRMESWLCRAGFMSAEEVLSTPTEDLLIRFYIGNIPYEAVHTMSLYALYAAHKQKSVFDVTNDEKIYIKKIREDIEKDPL